VNNLAQNNALTGLSPNAASIQFQNRAPVSLNAIWKKVPTIAMMHGCFESSAAQKVGKMK
jgi:hypothetical protein